MADRWEGLSKQAAQAMFRRRRELLNAAGPRPFKGLPVSHEEQLGHWNQIRHDPMELANLLAPSIRVKDDGRVLITKGFIKQLTALESELREGTL